MEKCTPFESLRLKTQDALMTMAEIVKHVHLLETNKWRFLTNNLTDDYDHSLLIDEVRNWAGKDNICLYTINLITPDFNLNHLKEEYKLAKKTKTNGRAYARVNEWESSCLYVGSSQDIAGRLRQHLGYGPKDTFALQLSHWANKFKLELELNCARYKSGFAPEVYQKLEDTLWEDMTPMFGRKGSR